LGVSSGTLPLFSLVLVSFYKADLPISHTLDLKMIIIKLQVPMIPSDPDRYGGESN
jgi:hypothetical protein